MNMKNIHLINRIEWNKIVTQIAIGKGIKIAVLVEKQLDMQKPVYANYVGLMVPNQYVFGCGMDVNGWWRNLPAIYAL